VKRETGVQRCPPSKGVLGWVLFPWVTDTLAANNFPGCADANGETVLTEETSPAFVSDAEFAAVPPPDVACQNFVIRTERQDLQPEAQDGDAPAAAP